MFSDDVTTEREGSGGGDERDFSVGHQVHGVREGADGRQAGRHTAGDQQGAWESTTAPGLRQGESTGVSAMALVTRVECQQ